MNTIKCCVCGKELKVGDKIYKDEKTLDYHCSLECMLDFYTTYTEQTLDEEFFDYCDDYYDNEEYEEEDEDNTFYDLNFIKYEVFVAIICMVFFGIIIALGYKVLILSNKSLKDYFNNNEKNEKKIKKVDS